MYGIMLMHNTCINLYLHMDICIILLLKSGMCRLTKWVTIYRYVKADSAPTFSWLHFIGKNLFKWNTRIKVTRTLVFQSKFAEMATWVGWFREGNIIIKICSTEQHTLELCVFICCCMILEPLKLEHELHREILNTSAWFFCCWDQLSISVCDFSCVVFLIFYGLNHLQQDFWQWTTR